jgi:phosphatidylinositol alpha-1,6-mannosyltransferase
MLGIDREHSQSPFRQEPETDGSAGLSSRNGKPGIILVTRNFPPLRGGMERLNFHIHEALQKNYEVYLIGPEGAEQYCGNAGRALTRPALPVWRFLAWAFWRTLRLALIQRPQLIVAGSGVAALPAVLAGRLAGIPVLTYLHGLDIVAAHPVYQHVFVPAIRRSTAWLANSRYTRQAAIRAGIPPERIEILHPGTDLPDLSRLDGGKEFRRRIHAGDRPILLSVGRLTRRKGLLEFIEQAFPEIVRQCPEALLVIVGSEPVHSVARAAEPMGEKLRARLLELGLEKNTRLLGGVDEATLADAYSASRLHVFPVLDLPGDAEGFGMVAVEAAAHGVPTVAFDVGGVSDAVEPGISGQLLPSGNYAGLAQAVIRYLRSPQPAGETQAACRRHAERFAWPRFGERLREMCSATAGCRE